jgi:DNA-directed RNA polymerase subunit M/transcription elongation factor TFIIS
MTATRTKPIVLPPQPITYCRICGAVSAMRVYQTERHADHRLQRIKCRSCGAQYRRRLMFPTSPDTTIHSV